MSKVTPPYLGAAYYPEDWPIEQIDDDIALMKQAGANVMRVAEFAWSRMEPEEGQYDFGWLHHVVDRLGKAEIAVIVCTPTCTPPVWLVERYPEVLFKREDGRPTLHGARRHTCPNNPVYREHCSRIVTRMAEEFGRDDRIIGWQIDNEVFPYTWPPRPCVCPVCVRKFQESMRNRFGTIQNLNATWGTDLWSQTYQSFSQLPIPDAATWHHPSLLSAWQQFTSDSYVDFVKHQEDILHRITGHQIGTDMMPFTLVDHGDMNRALDVVQFNHYNGVENLWQASFWFDFLRPLKHHPYWNTETQTCWNGSTAANGYKEPGFCRANSWLTYAQGGEANLYWLWRQHWSGQELMHGAVVSSTGRPLHVMSEVREISDGLKASADLLNCARPTITGLALHMSPHSASIFDFQPMVNGFNYLSALMDRAYHPLIKGHFRPDVIHPMVDLSPYRLILSPFLPALDEEGLRERMKSWIEDGGTWIVGPLSDIRTADATKFTKAPYGSLEEWAGVYCKYEIPGDPRDFSLRWADGRESNGSVWYDGLEARDAEILAEYTEGPLKGLAAATRRNMGKGRIIVLGTMPVAEDWRRLVLDIGAGLGITPVADASDNLLVVPRDGTMDGMIVVEIEGKPGWITLPEPMHDLIARRTLDGTIEVGPYGVMVLAAGAG